MSKLPDKSSLTGRILRSIVIVIILLIGIFGAASLMKSSPKTQSGKAPERVLNVEITQLQPTSAIIQVPIQGTVMAAHQSDLYPRTTADILSLSEHFYPGAKVKRGALLLALDPVDTRLALRRAQAAVEIAEANLLIEEGQQRVVAQEFKLQPQAKNYSENYKALMLRKPQLQIAKANLKDAKAALSLAEVEYHATEIKAPYDGIILNKPVDKGTRVNSTTRLTTIVSTEAFWLRVTTPHRYLSYLTTAAGNRQGSEVILRVGEATRKAELLSLLPESDSKSKMASLLIRIPEPLNTELGPSLLIDSFVTGNILGKEIEGVMLLNPAWIIEGKAVWIVKEDKVEKQPITIVHRNPDYVLVQGIPPHTSVITTLLKNPVPGTKVKVVTGDTE